LHLHPVISAKGCLLQAKVGFILLLLAFAHAIKLNAQNNLVKKVKYHDDNRLAIKEVYYTDSKNSGTKSGPYASFYTSGIARAKGNYLQNQPEGCWERFFETGILKSSLSYKAGKLEGPAIFFFENGKPAQSGHYKSNKEDSTWRFYYESGKLKSTGMYKNGVQEGFWRYFHEDSTLKATAFLQHGKGQYREFFASGGLKMEGIIVGGSSDSVWRYFHENGILKAIGHEKAGQRQGYWKFFFPNGSISSEGHFKDNEKFGRWKYYHETGSLSSEGDLEKDAREGVWKFFFPSGALMGEGRFSGGNGDYTEYYDNGKLRVKGRIENNVYEGTWTFYFEDGGLEGECFYRNGLGDYKGYYDNGALKMKGQMQNGQKVGSWDLMGRDGKLIGHYKTFYDMVQPAAEVARNKPAKTDSIQNKPKNLGKPDFMGNRRRSRHFIPKINELRGFILGMNPSAIALGSFPLSVEYFFHDRLGYEMMFTLYRQPFFKVHAEEIEPKRVFSTGNSLDIRQKLYNQDRGSGSFYIGQEIRITDLNYRLLLSERIDSLTTNRRILTGNENKIEFCLLFGDRLFREYNKHRTLTLDLYAGMGFGYRLLRIPEEIKTYKNLKTNRLTIPVRIGFNFGFLF
jgi:antitoxin component YwqK of YwqJK toxin-antitoxin module